MPRKKSKKITKQKVLHGLKRSSVIAGFLVLIMCVMDYAPNFVLEAKSDKVKLVINNNIVTSSLKHDIEINNETAYMSTDDIINFFDGFLIQDENNIITTSYNKTVNISKETNKLDINGQVEEMKKPLFYKEGKTYFSMETISTIYDMESSYDKDNKCLIMDSLDRKKVTALAENGLAIKYKTTIISKDVATVKKGETLTIVQANGKNVEINGWYKVRTEDGVIGYVKKSKLINETSVREDLKKNLINGKVSLCWDYFSPYEQAPKREGTIPGINVISPSFYNLARGGEINTNIGEAGQEYIKWAHSNGYKIWPTISNTFLNDIDAMSQMFKTFNSRQHLINNIVTNLKTSGVDGAIIDFENMYKEDKYNYSRFIIELAPRMHAEGLTLTVLLTAPDGSDTWSLCYDRNTIGKASDYVIFMGYDQTVGSSDVAGTVAGANWVELNINKFLKQEGIDKSKIILAVPFYTRLWAESSNWVSSSIVNMVDVYIPTGVTTIWNDATKQNYMEYPSGGLTYKMWIEDKDSISAKLDLVNSYELAGAGFWEKDRETDDIWEVAKEKLHAELQE